MICFGHDSLWSMIRTMERIMARKEISVKKYIVRLSAEERQLLETLIRKGKGPARAIEGAHPVEGGCLGCGPWVE